MILKFRFKNTQKTNIKLEKIRKSTKKISIALWGQLQMLICLTFFKFFNIHFLNNFY
jgi:hypothetical protein